MVPFNIFLCAVSTILAVDAFAVPRHGHGNAKAIYFQTNKSPNSVVAVPVSRNGTLSGGSLITTGGNGGNTVDATTGAPNGPDALSSQGSVRVAGSYLFTTNAGSNTISMFSISPKDPTKLTMLGAPGLTSGDFPTSIAVSSSLHLVCAALTGARSGISCAKFSSRGLGAFDALRPFNLGQTNPPTGPFNGIGGSFFSENSCQLITTVKGDPTVNNTGFMSIFPVSGEGVGSQDTRVSPDGTAVLFGATQIPASDNLLVTDASFGSFTVSLANPSTPLAVTKLADQKATCWAEISPTTGTGLVTDVAVNHLVNVDLGSGAVIQDFNSTNGNTGMVDFVAAGTKVFGLSPGAQCHVAVFDIASGIKDVQNLAISGADTNAQGMAVLMH